MRSKLLGPGGPPLSVIGFGAWEIGIDASVAAQERAVRAIHAGVEAGMNWIDTAEFYGMGLSEQLVARALMDRPDVMVFSKIWHRLHGGLTPNAVIQGAESTLARLRRDTIDLYLIVEPDPVVPVEQTWEAMAGLVDRGLARFIGVANFTPDLVQRCEAFRHVDAIQDQCSLLVRDRYDLLRSHCERYGTAFLAYGLWRSASSPAEPIQTGPSPRRAGVEGKRRMSSRVTSFRCSALTCCHDTSALLSVCDLSQKDSEYHCPNLRWRGW